MLRAAIIADDLTGAADTGIQFCRAEAPTYLLAQDHLRSFPFPAAPHSLALFTNTRNVPPDQAAEALGPAAAAIKDLRPSRIYKKIDSCLRGNIGAELDALAETLEFDASFVAPALPAQGRSVLHDVHYLRGVPLAETEMARDPVSPVTESRVSLVLGRQSRHAIAHVDLEILEGPPEGLGDHVRRLIRQGARHIVFDSASQAHLDALANLAVAQFPKTLLVGSAGLASSLSPLLFSGPAGTRTLLNPVGRRILFVCGSASGILDVQVLELVRSFSCSSYFLDPRDWVLRRGGRGFRTRPKRPPAAWFQGLSCLKSRLRVFRPLRPTGRTSSMGLWSSCHRSCAMYGLTGSLFQAVTPPLHS